MLNLTNDLSVKWQNLDAHEHKKLQKRAGKIGAEKRWKQKDATFGYSLKSEWDKNSAGKFNKERELKAEYETKFKKLYEMFSSISALSEGITSKTKGKVRSTPLKGIPVSFAIKPPNLSLSGQWNLERANNNKLGTKGVIEFNAKPLIGLEITIDLLGAIVFVASSIVGASLGVVELYKEIKGKLGEGIDLGNDKVGVKANLDIFMDLIISNTINVKAKIEFNTAESAKDSDFKIEADSKLKVELKVGVIIKGEIVILVVKAEACFEASAAGEASITFGHGIIYDDKGLYYKPKLGFDGLHAKYIIQVSAGLAIKIAKDKSKINIKHGGKHTFAEGDFPDVIPSFDVIKELEGYFGFSANIPLISNKK